MGIRKGLIVTAVVCATLLLSSLVMYGLTGFLLPVHDGFTLTLVLVMVGAVCGAAATFPGKFPGEDS